MGYVSASKDELGRLQGDGRGKMLLAVAFGWFLSISVRLIYPALLPNLRGAYDLTLTTAGLLLTVLWIAYAVGQLPGGILADWVGERPLLVVSSLTAAGMLTLVVVAESAVVLFAATALFGLGTAMYGISRFTILSEIYPDQIGTATGVTMAAGDIGNAVMPPTAGFIAAAVAWQYGFGFAIPLFLVAAVTLRVTLPVSSTESATLADRLSLGRVVGTLSRPAVLRGTFLLVLWGIIAQVFLGFYPTYLIDVKGIAPPTTGVLFGLFFAFGIVVKPVSGQAYDRIGVGPPSLVLMSMTAVALAALPFLDSVWSVLLITGLASSILGFETVVISDLTRRLPAAKQGTSLGALRTVYLGLSAVSPVVFGAVAERGYFDEGFFVVAGIAGLVIFIVFYTVDY